MKTALSIWIRRHWLPIALIVTGLEAWWILGLALENAQASIGPEFIPKLAIKLIYLAVAVFGTRFIVRFMFPTVGQFTETRGGTLESSFQYSWVCKPEDPRLLLCIITYLGAFLGVSLLLSLAAL
jgi:hypothetical protein